MMPSKKELIEARSVFEDNACDDKVPWKSAFNSFHYYLDLLQKSSKSVPESVLSIELIRCSELLRMKRLYPKGFSKSFILNKNENGRPL